MDIKQFTSLVRQSRDRILSKHAEIALLSALDAVALMKSRVINKRENARGSIFGTYSEGYQDLREDANLIGEAVNFSFTNKMWNSTTARVAKDTGVVVEILISPNATNAFKMVYNTERFGTILELNERELQIHANIYESKLKTI